MQAHNAFNIDPFVGGWEEVADSFGRYRTRVDVEKDLTQAKRSEIIALRENVAQNSIFEGIIGLSDAVRKMLAQLSKIARADSTVLISGETGTGKELIARAIHNRSSRSDKAFITVNCAAIPPALLASELFGHEKGAFTGALQRRIGRFESANGGSIFLDEIGELPPESQVALLRVLQERNLERVGGTQTISVNVRVIAATNRDLPSAVADKTFREDLFYRLNVIPLELPPLRERTGDIRLLVEYFASRFTAKTGKKIPHISRKSLELLQSYSWPGNVRELQNIIERAVILCDDDVLCIEETWLTDSMQKPAAPTLLLSADLAQRERDVIETTLLGTKGLISGPQGAAAKLGIPRQTLESKIRRLGINWHYFKAV